MSTIILYGNHSYPTHSQLNNHHSFDIHYRQESGIICFILWLLCHKTGPRTSSSYLAILYPTTRISASNFHYLYDLLPIMHHYLVLSVLASWKHLCGLLDLIKIHFGWHGFQKKNSTRYSNKCEIKNTKVFCTMFVNRYLKYVPWRSLLFET